MGFDVSTGEGQGNFETLRSLPAKFFPEHRRYYVSTGPAPIASVVANATAASVPSVCASAAESATVETSSTPLDANESVPTLGAAASNAHAVAGIAVGSCEMEDAPTANQGDDHDNAMDVDPPEEPILKRQRSELPTPVRTLI